MEMWLCEHSMRPGCALKAPLLLICLLQGSETRGGIIWISLMLFSAGFFPDADSQWARTACLSLCRSRDSPLFITRFINLNANWFLQGPFSARGGPTPVSPRWLSVRARVTRTWSDTSWQCEPLLAVCPHGVRRWYGFEGLPGPGETSGGIARRR